MQGAVRQPKRALRAVCYCGDCQAYAHVLGQPESVLDSLGGTEVVGVSGAQVSIATGTRELACLSLSPRGLLRWYASCCRTPIGNTPRNWKLPYVGLVHTCLRKPDSLEQSFPRVQLRAYTRSASGPAPRGGSVGGLIRLGGLMARITGSRLSGGYKDSPFFDGGGRPVAVVAVAPHEAVEAARRAIERPTSRPAA